MHIYLLLCVLLLINIILLMFRSVFLGLPDNADTTPLLQTDFLAFFSTDDNSVNYRDSRTQRRWQIVDFFSFHGHDSRGRAHHYGNLETFLGPCASC